jgi:SAM-dependent methyltransferase
MLQTSHNLASYFAPVFPEIASQIKHKAKNLNGLCVEISGRYGCIGAELARITDLEIVLLDDAAEFRPELQPGRDPDLKRRIKIRRGSIERIPFRDRAVNLLISRGMVFFWEDQARAFQEIYRVLAPGGAAFIGGGFGTRESKEQIAARLSGQSNAPFPVKAWAEIAEDFERALWRAGIGHFEVTCNDDGLWIEIRKPQNNRSLPRQTGKK